MKFAFLEVNWTKKEKKESPEYEQSMVGFKLHCRRFFRII